MSDIKFACYVIFIRSLLLLPTLRCEQMLRGTRHYSHPHVLLDCAGEVRSSSEEVKNGMRSVATSDGLVQPGGVMY